MVDEVRKSILEPNQLTEVACFINDQAFADASLAILDDWTRSGVVRAVSWRLQLIDWNLESHLTCFVLWHFACTHVHLQRRDDQLWHVELRISGFAPGYELGAAYVLSNVDIG